MQNVYSKMNNFGIPALLFTKINQKVVTNFSFEKIKILKYNCFNIV